jgi:hypothetical protein
MRIVWIVVERTAPDLLLDPSTFRTGSGVLSCHRVRPCFVAKLELMIIPSAPLSTSARALISLPECFPTRDTRSVIEGLLIFLIVPLGTGSEFTVSNKVTLWISNWGSRGVSINSAAIEPSKNPWDQQGTGVRRSDIRGCDRGLLRRQRLLQ